MKEGRGPCHGVAPLYIRRRCNVLVILKRIGIALFTIFVIVSLTFFLVRKTPGDVMQAWAMDLVQTYSMTYEDALSMVQSWYSYDPHQPLLQQYITYISGLLRGDLGKSFIYKVSVNEVLVRALPWTAFVVSISLFLSFGIGILLGMAMAWKRKSFLDPLVTAYASFTGATPDYITALILLIIFAVNLHIFPLKGAYDATIPPGLTWPFIKSVLMHAALPIAAYTFEHAASWALAMKGSAVGVLGEDYIMAARARGLKEGRIMIHYMGRNAILPLVTGLAISLGGMVGGSALIETIFSYPGIGWFFAEALTKRDFGLMQGLFLFLAASIIFANLLADILYSVLDPRIKLEG
ncbi:MAG TPA: ABC transporter permease [Chloroflexi bacterium]|nr:ABC transporter permease [Chloroflexota bacterium]